MMRSVGREHSPGSTRSWRTTSSSSVWHPPRLWFIGGIGPVKVPEAASAVARPGWTINLVLGRHGTTWDVLEVGNVYPETLA